MAARPLATGRSPPTVGHPRILILGGYGNTGRLIARLLLEESAAALIVAGRNLGQAQALATALNEGQARPRVVALRLDAADVADLRRSLADVDLLLVASSTVDHAQQVAEAALDAGADYLDIQVATHKNAMLRRLAPAIEAAGCCFITDGGFHPGLPAALIRYVAPCFDRLEQANVGSVIKIDWSALSFSPATLEEFVGEFADFQSLVFRGGRWQRASMLRPETMDFGQPFGRQYCLPMFLEELQELPDCYPHLRETGFFVGGFNWFVDWLVSPLVVAALRLWPNRVRGPMGRLMHWGLRTFSRPPYGVRLKLEARGQVNSRPHAIDLLVGHEDGYWLTAAPVVACLNQYLDGTLRRPGLWLQATAVQPERFIRDLQRMGVTVDIQVHPAQGASHDR